jgi:glutaconate CoA-transferase subunit A
MKSKLASLKGAVSRHVHDGDTIFVGGFGQCVPFATAHEIIRQNRRNLTLCRSGADILFDMMIGAGAVKKVIFGYVGNPGIGLDHAFRRAVESGELEVEDWTNFSMVLRLHAGALGVPFLPTATLLPGDLSDRVDTRPITCPFTGEELSAVPALTPDVGIMHAHRADEEGNVQLFGLPGDTLEGINASKRIIVTVEEIVPREVIRSVPDRTIVPGFRVAAVCLVPWGAYPSYVDGRYDRDDEVYGAWDGISRSAERLSAWLDREIRNTVEFADYIERIKPVRLETLIHNARSTANVR